MDKFNSNDRKPSFDGSRKLQLKKKTDSNNNYEQGNKRSYNNDYNNTERKPFVKRDGNSSYNNGNSSYNNNRSRSYGNNSDNSYNNRERREGGSSYNRNSSYDSNRNSGNSSYNRNRVNGNTWNPNGGGERFERRDNNDRRNNNYNNNRPSYNSNRPDNRFRQNNYQQQTDDVRYDDNNKKIVFRKRKSVQDGEVKKKRNFEAFREEVDLTKPIRLNKFLANAGICSRREADDYIQSGVITVNDEVVTELGTKILPTDKVLFHNEPVHTERKIYLILNKPKDFVTTVEDTHDRKIVMDLVKNACSERIYPVGRLDRNTTGVLLFTNDGDLASKLTHPKFEKKKIYQVALDKDLTEDDFNKILEGIDLEDGVIKADDLAFVADDSRNKVGIEIHSGKNRVVRRLFDKLGYRVIHLDRVYFAGLTKKNLPRGRYRFLTGKEIAALKMGAYE